MISCNLPCCGTYERVPFTFILPLNLFISPRTLYSNEDFPEPTEPTTASNLPCLSLNVRLERKEKPIDTFLFCSYSKQNKCILAKYNIISVVRPRYIHISK